MKDALVLLVTFIAVCVFIFIVEYGLAIIDEPHAVWVMHLLGV